MPHINAGKKVLEQNLENIPKLISDYYLKTPSIKESSQKVNFGTSGHRGSSKHYSFNETHILAISQALCEYRKQNNICGTLFIAKDTHALSTPAQITALQVFVANGIECKIAKDDDYTPTPVLSFTILEANKKNDQLCDGVVITPSHNPPSDGGFKYNSIDGGPADVEITSFIENRANEIIANGMQDIKYVSYEEVLKSDLVEEFDFVTPYVKALNTIVDIDAIKGSDLKIAVDPMGGSGITVYKKIKEIYGLNLEILNEKVDPTFSFMTCDHDGKIRMDCSSKFAMSSLIGLKDKYDIAFANDPDFDRHGIVTKSVGLMNPNHYLSVAIWYLSSYRSSWKESLKVGKTLVSSSMIDKIVNSLNKELFEVPVGFKWYVKGLYDSTIAFGGEESAGASFLRMDGTPWSTDKDGIILNLLSAEITAKIGRDPGEIYQDFEEQFGKAYYARIDAAASSEQKAKLKNLTPSNITSTVLANDMIENIFTNAAGNNASIGGLKVATKNGWFAARPSGTEDIYKIYAESFISQEHLKQIQQEAQEIVTQAIK
jgi:phosphoglucomutase